MRLVVHIGGMRTACSAVQRGVAANAKQLRRAGVLVPMAGRASVGRGRIAHDLLAPLAADDESAASSCWRELVQELSSASDSTAFVTSALLEASARHPAARKVLDAGLTAARLAGIEVTVVYVVRDQLAQLNGSYVDRVAALTETESFDSFSRQLVRSGDLNLHRVFHPWYQGPPEFIALPYPDVVSGDPLTTVLSAARVDVPADGIRPAGVTQAPLLGPLGVEAVRLLGRHLLSVDPAFDPTSPGARRVADLALERAAAAGWADDGYWAWSPEQASQVANRLEAPNRMFARAVWQADWPLPMPVGRKRTATTLLHTPVDELTEIQRFASTLVRNYLEIRSGRPISQPRPAADTAPAAAGTPRGKAANREQRQRQRQRQRQQRGRAAGDKLRGARP